MTDKKLSADVERRFNEWRESGQSYRDPRDFVEGWHKDRLSWFIADELAIARAELLLELLQVFNDYDVPLTMTAVQVRDILQAYLTKKE